MGPWSRRAAWQRTVAARGDGGPDLHQGPPPGGRLDAEAAAAVGDGPLQEPEPDVALFKSVRLFGGIEAPAVIDDAEDNIAAMAADLYGEVVRARVLHGVAHRLLGDAVEEPVGALAEDQPLLDVELGGDAGAEVDEQILQRRPQSQFPQLGGGDLDDQAAQIAGRSARRLGALGDELQQAGAILRAESDFGLSFVPHKWSGARYSSRCW